VQIDLEIRGKVLAEDRLRKESWCGPHREKSAYRMSRRITGGFFVRTKSRENSIFTYLKVIKIDFLGVSASTFRAPANDRAWLFLKKRLLFIGSKPKKNLKVYRV